MFKSIIFTVISISLAAAAHAQEKKELPVPAFLMPATVLQTDASVTGPGESDKAHRAEINNRSMHTLEFTDPASAAKIEMRSNKPIRVIAVGNKADDHTSSQPAKKTDSK